MEREMIEKPEEKEFFLSQKKMIEKKENFFFLSLRSRLFLVSLATFDD